MTPESLVASLLKGDCPEGAVWELKKAVRMIVDGIASDSTNYNATATWKACRALNAQRYFELTLLIGSAWDCRDFDPAVAFQYVQALIDLSQLNEAEALLDKCIQNIGLATTDQMQENELSKYKGLKGRIHKQRHVCDEDNSKLLEAFTVYHEVYLKNPRVNYWQGVNALALLARAERLGLSMPVAFKVTTLAEQLHEELQLGDMDDPWKLATMSEICVALGKEDNAELWLYRLLYAPKCTPFMLESYARQLREIWGAGLHNGGRRIQDKLCVIIARHQMARQSMFSLIPPVSFAAQQEFERNFSGAGTFTVDTIKNIMYVCAAIGCVCNSKGMRLGTGFLIDADALGLAGGDKVFVTNAHVLSDSVDGAIRSQDALVTFELAYPDDGRPVFHAIKEIIFSSPPGPLAHSCEEPIYLDVTVARLASKPSNGVGLRVSAALPIVDGQAKAFVIGHPRGSGLQIAIHDSELLDIDDRKRLLHYRTPTDPGSSGSPVFNEEWHLIGLHHGGSSKMPRFRPLGSVYQANEGVSIHAIRTCIQLARQAVASPLLQDYESPP
ncbi:serine protease [Undibacterium sp. Ji42W]|uniref:serine protease n=1 Tax=Undibacterium sp. Ji42W TaxID=3413039 RepID=UPI003BF2EE06